ncbi:hypothetical protein APE_0239 [Aeropyrum pernix K1]|uniref:Uncharacterized protein n=1 Tax=Aeropyrum pernix (strain ATCC 700893 / DSM 11879 / JCM 9820 / NBRC 100138 / K1) TaxID=272557 RepID=Q9YFK9_AERPE|nr:hypothetical protein APE_0239 [Aeropyrum pernix K1]
MPVFPTSISKLNITVGGVPVESGVSRRIASPVLYRELVTLSRKALEIDSEIALLGSEEEDVIDYIVLTAARRIVASDLAEILEYLSGVGEEDEIRADATTTRETASIA